MNLPKIYATKDGRTAAFSTNVWNRLGDNKQGWQQIGQPEAENTEAAEAEVQRQLEERAKRTGKAAKVANEEETVNAEAPEDASDVADLIAAAENEMLTGDPAAAYELLLSAEAVAPSEKITELLAQCEQLKN